ncbi:MAG: GAF domain-containing protein [Candidatus Thiodiazotropha sp. (ex Dulcina madagascariensis)]|nr:GAF domain-containing protein [Candidatus Thiodiazotropha sp. (ex Dulcina madagascariensis)]MCU7928561.1 GAF domain-containing protein [Candidatus Thiodiazotropha sp. (ex Dulcina madagascariensis)]
MNISLSNCEIMVVDDTPESLKLLADLLISEGYRVRPTKAPRLALASAFDNPPTLILLDIKMPEMDGFEMCQRLKQDKRTAEVPVIFISALQEMRDQVRGFEVGGVDYISKPIQREEVLARVSAHLQLHMMQQHLAALVEEKTQQLQLDEQRFEALYRLSQMGEASEEELATYALETAVSMTDSEVGYLHFMNANQKHIDLYLWSEETIERRTAEPSSHLPLSEARIWADCIRTKRPAIHNNHPDLENKNGLPEGHFPLQRHMSVPIVDKEKIVAIIGVGDKPHPYSEDDARQLSLFGGSMWTIIFGHRKDALLKKSLMQTIQAFAMTLEQRDPYTAGHQRRVADLSCAIARELGLEQDMIEGIGMGGIIHDLGKISVPAEILNRPGKLSEPELAIIKLHPEVGYQILKDIDFPWPVVDMIHQHHERIDGSGYPYGLKGDEISFEARIMAVADVVEAMATDRPYRAGLGLDAALEELKRGRGKIYDPEVVDSCVRLFTEKGYSLDINR